MKKLVYLIFLLCSLNANAQSKKECENLMKAEKQVEANIKMYKETWDKIFNQRDINQVNDKNFATDVLLLNQKEKVPGNSNRKWFQRLLQPTKSRKKLSS